MIIISLTKKFLENVSLQLVPKKLSRDLWLPAPSDSFKHRPPELGSNAHWIPYSGKSDLHPQNRGTTDFGYRKELSSKNILKIPFM